ncbi:hypothetical protein FRB99_000228 [Tulasnella sp. 403]|nr:hypothetical protein FRB99_000228 [Tulasnella sp. 403]
MAIDSSSLSRASKNLLARRNYRKNAPVFILFVLSFFLFVRTIPLNHFNTDIMPDLDAIVPGVAVIQDQVKSNMDTLFTPPRNKISVHPSELGSGHRPRRPLRMRRDLVDSSAAAPSPEVEAASYGNAGEIALGNHDPHPLD